MGNGRRARRRGRVQRWCAGVFAEVAWTRDVRRCRGLERGFADAEKAYARVWLAQAPSVLEKVQPALEALASAEPFFLFAHFSDPHEPYNAHGTFAHEATLYRDGEEVGPIPMSDMTTWSRRLLLEPGPNVFEVRSDI